MTDRLSRYRDEIKGIAIIWIVLFHSDMQLGSIAGSVLKYGYGGVDIFMLLSGFGLYRSLQKSSDLCGYLQRRAWRVLPAYLPFCVLWLCIMLPYFGMSLVQSARVALGSLTMTGWFADVKHITNWYVSLMLLTIMLAPLAYAVLSRSVKPYAALGAMVALTGAVSVCFWGKNSLMIYSRLPIFLIGMGMAMPCKIKNKPTKSIAFGAASFLIGTAILAAVSKLHPEYLNDIGMYWYPFILITPPLCLGLAWMFGKLDKAKRFFAPLRFIGKASFEIFLFNSWAEITAEPLGFTENNIKRLIFALLSIAVGSAYHIVVREVMKRVKAHKKLQKSAE